MAYESVDKLQNALSENIFHYTKDKKKAAGRALGTIIEIITYYLLKTWGFNNSISIERSLIEYGNDDISHNVEYALQPITHEYKIKTEKSDNSLTTNRIFKAIGDTFDITKFTTKSNVLLDKNNVLRNACTIGETTNSLLLASIKERTEHELTLSVFEQLKKPYAIIECKRVGVEEGMKKGPQTIEKAKQGAYVARTASSLQKIRTDTGEKYGLIYKKDNTPYIKPYLELMEEIINSNDSKLLKKFILTIGIISNHGNWFTAENQNKEIKVLAQSYDWLLFLTDNGFAQFIDELLLNPEPTYRPVQQAFKNSYTADKKRNVFTKIKMDIDADTALQSYFQENIQEIENWFNIITPEKKSISYMKKKLKKLKEKKWEDIL